MLPMSQLNRVTDSPVCCLQKQAEMFRCSYEARVVIVLRKPNRPDSIGAIHRLSTCIVVHSAHGSTRTVHKQLLWFAPWCYPACRRVLWTTRAVASLGWMAECAWEKCGIARPWTCVLEHRNLY